ncbi:MAG TPA: hypothetical protein PLO62_00590 [Candidatus Hydrogenedentes bacterium]|nr:hypothetical protein [Candidatus Hydrogenedentota bacterium]HOS01607.1 hypothetical protein [Candidatus Hydrogenedentota bacterium]
MKHVQVRSMEKPAGAAWFSLVEWRNLTGKTPLTTQQTNWVLGEVNQFLTK